MHIFNKTFKSFKLPEFILERYPNQLSEIDSILFSQNFTINCRRINYRLILMSVFLLDYIKTLGLTTKNPKLVWRTNHYQGGFYDIAELL